MVNGPTFSIIVPTYNRQQYLLEAIDSVLGQTYPEFEIIVVDDASPNRTVVPDDPRIRLVRRSCNGGAGAAFNDGLLVASGIYVTFLADDDWLEPGRLEIAREGLSRAPIALCWFAYEGEPAHGRILDGIVPEELFSRTTPSLGATVVRRDICARFDESYRASQDLEWWVRMAKFPVATVPEVGYRVRKHAGVRHGNNRLTRIEMSIRMLEVDHKTFFDAHPRAAAFRWRRIAYMLEAEGDSERAREALGKSWRVRPHPATAWHILRTQSLRH